MLPEVRGNGCLEPNERGGKGRGQGSFYRGRKEGQRVSGLMPAGLLLSRNVRRKVIY